jgi:CRP/FNR family cyclic AMP-dependent transcriptional regulator
LAKDTPERVRLIGMLGKVPLFSGLGDKELRKIADAGREVSFQPGKTVLKEGDPGLSFLLVLEGKVEVRKGGRKLAATGPGGFFGEMTVFDDKPRSADVVAVEPTTCFGMTSWAFIPLLQSDPNVAIGMIKELVVRLRRLEEEPSI